MSKDIFSGMLTQPLNGAEGAEPPRDASWEGLRLKFWEIGKFLTCPVVGLCLSLKEQKQILKKAGVSLKQKDEFQIHEILVACGTDENRISRKIDALLVRKFIRQAEPLYRLEASVFENTWKSSFEKGAIGAALWVAATRCDLSAAFRRVVFGDIHMAMHGNAEREARARIQAVSQGKKLKIKEQHLKTATLENRALRDEAAGLKREQVDMKKRLESAEKRIRELSSLVYDLSKQQPTADLERENHLLGIQVRQLTEELRRSLQQQEIYEARLSKAQKELDRWQASLPVLRAEARALLQQDGAAPHCDASCPAFNLCEKRVLVVGGMSRIASFYRDLIEDVGGVFEYHDGHMKGGRTALESRLRRADMVLCPVSCNSHAACTLVKKLGKKHKKPVHMLANSSQNTVANALRHGESCCINGHLAN